jgi:UDP-2-acetamido-2,6-beta-L-arabino-hexul-4-ose reductase
MKVLVTGSDGFIGKNLIERLSRVDGIEVIKFNSSCLISDLVASIDQIDYVFHLAGVNRPINEQDYFDVNSDFTLDLVNFFIKHKRHVPILFSSSTQAKLDNGYGKSKLSAENHIINYSQSFSVPAFIYRLPGVFGKWSKPNYNSVIATWCFNVLNNQPVSIDQKNKILELVYIDDVVESFFDKLKEEKPDFNCQIPIKYSETLGRILDLIKAFKESRENLLMPNVGSGFERALYATYLSFMKTDEFSYKLNGHIDDRGTFYEVLKTFDSGQVSISTTKPGNTVRGNHYHNTKNEKFLVVKGQATIKLRHIIDNKTVSYHVSDKVMEVVEMIPGYTHNIINTSEEELVLLIWANEVFDTSNPDTYSEIV